MAAFSRRNWSIFALVILAAELPNLVGIRQITGSSMKPTFNPDTSLRRDYVLVDKTPVSIWNYTSIRRGDVVSVRSVENPKQVNVKRVVGLPGDTIMPRSTSLASKVVIPEGRIWIEGDESFRSRDSNTYGPVPIGCIQGKVVAILWPPDRFGKIPGRNF